ncbi:glycosyltransferase family 4 protein [candidate division WOR-3 bacterium]|nr:glycosyltransferase family 4 protein [candidate division WOR-3 bacterium]
MKFLIVNTFHYYRGGDCTYTFNVSKLLKEMGDHRVVHFAMKHPLNLPSEYSEFFVPEIDLVEELAKKSIKSGIKVLKRVIYSIVSKKQLSKLLDKYPVNIAQIHNIHGHITPSIFHVLKKRNIPIIWRLSDYFLLCPNSTFYSKNRVCEECKGKRFYNVIIKKCRKNSYAACVMVMFEEYIHRLIGLLKLVDYFIAPSNFLRNKMIEYGFPPYKVIHIPTFIETKNIKVSSEADNYFLYSGRLSYEKGLKTLIKSMSLNTSSKLLLAGDGPLRPELEKAAKKIASNKIKFLGHVGREKMEEFIAGASFVVLPSEWYENLPNSILEAFASGKPVVGSRIGGIPELVRDGETGLLFEPGNSNDLAEKMQWMIKHPKERQEMGQRARELVEKEYNSKLHYKRLMKVYKMALNEHGKEVS